MLLTSSIVLLGKKCVAFVGQSGLHFNVYFRKQLLHRYIVSWYCSA